MKRFKSIAAVAIAVCIFWSGPARSQVDCDAAEDLGLADSFKDALIELAGSRCLAQEANQDDPVVQGFVNLTPDVGTAIIERVENFSAANEFLRDHAQTMSGAAAEDRDLWVIVALELAKQGQGIAAARGAESPDEARRRSANAISPDTWELDVNRGTVRAIPNRSIFDGLDMFCPASDTGEGKACPAYRDRKAMVRLILLARDLTGYNEQDILFAQLLESRIANKQWDAYFNEAHFQWWWEVWLNGRRMLKGDGCDSNKETQIRDGFCAVPTSQLIFLHPDIALAYVDSAASSDDLKGAFVVEVFGFNKWDWSPDGKMQRARGWSVIASYTNQNDSNDWGYGLMYHYRNRYSLGVTTTSGDIGAILSVDLSDKLFERKAKYKNYLQELQKPSFWSGVFTED